MRYLVIETDVTQESGVCGDILVETVAVDVCADSRAVHAAIWRVQRNPLETGTHTTIGTLRAELEGYGMTLAERPFEKHVRGFTTSSNDRWFGPGACKTYGGAAYTGMMVAKYGSKDAIGG